MDIRELVVPALKDYECYKAAGQDYRIILNANEHYENFLSTKLQNDFIEKMKNININRYPDPDAKKLRKAYADLINVDMDKLIATSGSDEGITIISATFVDKDDFVKYFSEGKERTFIRTRSIIGRNVSNCHPPASVHIVEKIVNDFKTGRKDQEDFWIKLGDKFVLIRYYAVRNDKGEYLGVLEVTQDIKEIQQIVGEKRLVSE